ncbi:glycerophosphoryl diester phosphodiesterase membrane domain-containing protein [candidate division WOR-3 bacterium]|nr:glycerophosphoryl diester phosphodiesterase membrane domain-containing protein [candidate division WOR-3 bacterium]
MEEKNKIKYNLIPGVFECYGHGWRHLWKNFLELFVVYLIFNFASQFMGIFFIPMYLIGLFENEPNFLIFIFLFIAIVGIFATAFMFLVVKPMQFGISYLNLKASRGEKLEIKEMFSPFMDFWNVVLAGFLSTLIVGFGALFFIIPGIIFACKLIFVPYIVMDKKMKATDAIKESWDMTDGHAWTVFGIGVLAVPIIIAGYICLFVGVIISIMWIYIAFASLYHAVRLKKG